MRGVNKAILIGNVGSDPDIRATQSGTRVAKFSLATNRIRKTAAGSQEETQWHRITVFGKLVDVVENYVHRGDRLYVEGRIEYSQTTDEHGGKRYWTDIICYELTMLGGTQEPAAVTEPQDDLPW